MNMKKIFLAAALLFVCGTLTRAEAQDLRSFKRNELTFSPIHFFDGTFKIGYQRNFRTSALEISPSAIIKNSGGYYDNGLTGWALEGGYKLFFKEYPRTFMMYVGPWAFYKFLEDRFDANSDYHGSMQGVHSTKDLNSQYSILGAGVYFGLHWTFGRFVMDLNIGGGVRTSSVSGYATKTDNYYDDDDFFEPGYRGMIPRGNFSVGILL